MVSKSKTVRISMILIVLLTIVIASVTYISAAAAKPCGTSSPCDCGTGCLFANGGSSVHATINDCADGFANGASTGRVDNISVSVVDGSTFLGGATVNVTATVQCTAAGEWVRFVYHNGSAWRRFHTIPNECYNTIGYSYYNSSLVLDNVGGAHTVRVITITSGSFGSESCGYDKDILWSDTDELSFQVVATGGPDVVIDSIDYPADKLRGLEGHEQ